jgi:hypothetical protein
MRVLWTLLKIVIVLALAIPVSIIMLAAALGLLGALVGIAILALKVAVVGLVMWGVFKIVARLIGGPSKRRTADMSPQPLLVDPHYEAAMRELDQELGHVSR